MKSVALLAVYIACVLVIYGWVLRDERAPSAGAMVPTAAAERTVFDIHSIVEVTPPDRSGFGVYATPDRRRFIGKPSADGGTVAVWRWVPRYTRPIGSTQYVKATSES